MDRVWKRVGFGALAASLVLALTAGVAFSSTARSDLARERKIVVLKAGASASAATGRFERAGAVIVRDLPLANAVAVSVAPGVAKRLAEDPSVKLVEDDAVVHATRAPVRTPPAEVLPWGIARVQAPSVWTSTTADVVKVGIIDTGIDATHPDLVGNIKGGVSEVSYTTSWKDDNGHGSHVAGIVGAVDNAIGVVGVAPNVDLYAIKVLDRRGSGYISDIITGLGWAVTNHMDVVNMSLGTSSYSSAFETAVNNAAAAGVTEVCAAGNSGPSANTVEYPGKFAKVIAVAATDSNNAIASFSSRGPEVDIAAPGVSIYSTYNGGGYQTLSGTSMATPHVAGVAALVISTPVGAWDTNGDGRWQSAEVQAKLQARAQDLGAAGRDDLFGYGLVRADLAVQP